MHVGTITLRLVLHEVHSLKEKRQIVQSVIDTTHRRFNVAIAEVGDLDLWQSALLGVAAVSNDARHLNSLLDNVTDFLERSPDFDVSAADIELF